MKFNQEVSERLSQQQQLRQPAALRDAHELERRDLATATAKAVKESLYEDVKTAYIEENEDEWQEAAIADKEAEWKTTWTEEYKDDMEAEALEEMQTEYRTEVEEERNESFQDIVNEAMDSDSEFLGQPWTWDEDATWQDNLEEAIARLKSRPRTRKKQCRGS